MLEVAEIAKTLKQANANLLYGKLNGQSAASIFFLRPEHSWLQYLNRFFFWNEACLRQFSPPEFWFGQPRKAKLEGDILHDASVKFLDWQLSNFIFPSGVSVRLNSSQSRTKYF